MKKPKLTKKEKELLRRRMKEWRKVDIMPIPFPPRFIPDFVLWMKRRKDMKTRFIREIIAGRKS